MPTYLIFDTETTGQPVKDMPSDYPGHPRVIQLAAELCDDDGNTLHRMCMLMNPVWGTPNRLFMDPDAEAVHGLSIAHILDKGLPPPVVLGSFYAMWTMASATVCHGKWFDNKMMKIEKARTGIGGWLEDKPMNCTMLLWQKRFGGRWKALTEIYATLFGQPHENSHRADTDVAATKKVFYELKRSGDLSAHILPHTAHTAEQRPVPVPEAVPSDGAHSAGNDSQA